MLEVNDNFLEKKSENENINKKELFEQGMSALNFCRPFEAIKYFSLLKEERNSAISFNIALCYLKIKKYDTVLLYLQKALSEIKRNRSIKVPENDYLELLNFEEENESYKKPMLYLTPFQFPDLAKDQILRLMIDILFILEKKEEMYKVIDSLKNKNYKNIKTKIGRG
ncbi:hypothetical protein [Fusobacterium canifelinum]|uniref:Tetratricopeptide repeat protein n=1 Tax=Fusobacterium canifelinum TaxID=285729 RepID=A0A3P1UQG1_9FUSO|nr:hypothetical protein [Fusobacterium canifelinum]RRD22783.1 hypothetical protein EII27_09200 [Fusobacterium canifelinum]